MDNHSNLSAPSILVSILTFIGSLSVLEAAGVVVGIVFTIAVGVSAIRRNNAQRSYYEKAMRDE